MEPNFCNVRNACGSEQKVNFELVEQRKAMEKSMVSMAPEIQQMWAELANFDWRPWGTGRPYGMKMGGTEATVSTQYRDNTISIQEFLTKVLRILLNLREAHMRKIISSTAKIPAATFPGERIIF